MLLIAACAALANAASAAPWPPQTTASVVGVTIDASVVDAQGRPIPGLAASDFAVQLDGQPRRVVAATFHPSGAPLAGAVGPVFDAVTAAAPVYRLVVQPPDGTQPGQEFALSLTVSRAGASADAPRRVAAALVSVSGMLTPAASSSAASASERLRAAIASGRRQTGLAILIGRAIRRGGGAAPLALDVQIDVQGSPSEPLSALLALVDARGAVRTATPPLEARPDGTHGTNLSLPLDAGVYTLRVAVTDSAGAIGAIDAPVSARLTALGPLAASDLLRWTADGRGRRPLLVDVLSPAVATIGATLELYPAPTAAMPDDLLVKVEFAGIERIVTPEPRDGVLLAEAEFPLDRLPAGAYTMRATVTSAATVLGTVSAAVVKR